MRAPRVRGLRRRGNVGGLIEALSYEDWIAFGGGEKADSAVPVRLRSLEALAELASSDHVPAIAVALGDADPAVRQSAVRVIRRLGPEEAAGALAAAVVGPEAGEFAEVRLEALAALRELGGSGGGGAVRSIAAAIVDGGSEVAFDQITQDALLGLVAEAPPAEVSRLVEGVVAHLAGMNGSLENAQALLTWLGASSVGPLIDSLAKDGDVREPAVAVLGAIRDSRALEAMVAALEDQRPSVRRVAVWALGELRDPRCVDALMRATMDDEYAVRRQAGEALDEMGSIALMAGVANMIRSLEDRSDGSTVARLVEEGLEHAPGPPRPGTRSRWAPRFFERLQRGQRRS